MYILRNYRRQWLLCIVQVISPYLAILSDVTLNSAVSAVYITSPLRLHEIYSDILLCLYHQSVVDPGDI